MWKNLTAMPTWVRVHSRDLKHREAAVYLQIRLLNRRSRSWKGLVVLWVLRKMRFYLIVLSTHWPTSPLSSVIDWVDSPTCRLHPTFHVSIISSLVTSPYAQQGMHWSWRIPSSSTAKVAPSLWWHHWRALSHQCWSTRRKSSAGMRRDCKHIKGLFRNVSCLTQPSLCGEKWKR